MKFEKYFWDLNQEALKETEKILASPEHPKFMGRIIVLLSRCDKPKEIFSIITREQFKENWPKIRAHWMKQERRSEFRDWWDAIYEQLMEEAQLKIIKPKGQTPEFFKEFGKLIKEARIRKGLSQKQLAQGVGMKQPDISKIEEGKNNITLFTLMRLCKILEIKKIDMS